MVAAKLLVVACLVGISGVTGMKRIVGGLRSIGTGLERTARHARNAIYAVRAGGLPSSQLSSWADRPAHLSKSNCANGIAFITDIEGDPVYWDNWKQHAVKKGAVVESTGRFQSPDGTEHSLHSLRVGENWCIVNGGDTVDKGVGSLRVLRELLELKKSAPSRVALILGNRDLNKIRLVRELELPAAQRPDFKPWIGFKDSDLFQKYDNFKNDGDLASDVAFLQWIQKKSMGAPKDFEQRREEMSSGGQVVDDSKVFATYVNQGLASGCMDRKFACMGDQGLMYLYLLAGQTVAASVDMKSLFMHGGLNSKNLFTTWPDSFSAPATAKNAENAVKAWVENEFTWKNYQMNKVYYGADKQSRDDAIFMLSEAALGNNLHGKEAEAARPGGYSTYDNIVNVRSTGRDNQLSLGPDAVDVAKRLEASGIVNIVVGHTPRGIVPDAKVFPEGLTVINGDTSCNPPHHHQRFDPAAEEAARALPHPEDHPLGTAPWIHIRPGGHWSIQGSVQVGSDVVRYKVDPKIIENSRGSELSAVPPFERRDVRAKVLTSSKDPEKVKYIVAHSSPSKKAMEENPKILPFFLKFVVEAVSQTVAPPPPLE